MLKIPVSSRTGLTVGRDINCLCLCKLERCVHLIVLCCLVSQGDLINDGMRGREET